VRVGAALAAAAVAGALALVTARAAAAKSAIYETRTRCPCTGPTADTFWRSRSERLACVEAALDALESTWPESVLRLDRRRERRSPCGVPRLQCDGTANRPCPRGTFRERSDPRCQPNGSPGVSGSSWPRPGRVES
jgi:hypothetical protein